MRQWAKRIIANPLPSQVGSSCRSALHELCGWHTTICSQADALNRIGVHDAVIEMREQSKGKELEVEIEKRRGCRLTVHPV